MDPVARRQFLKSSAAGTAALAVGACGSSWQVSDKSTIPAAEARAPESTLARIKGPGVAQNLGPALVKLLKPLGGMQAFVGKGQTVMLKPNMSFAKPVAFRATTSAGLIAAVARLALEQGAGKVIVADHPVSDADDVIKAMGLKEALQGLDVQVLKVDGDSPWVEKAIPGGKSLSSARFLELALKADVHIAMPLAKSHSSAGFTATLKGMMGLIRSRVGFHVVRDLHQSVVDLNRVLKPQLVIMDGLEVMTTGGPQGPGKLVQARSLIAGTDPVAVDAAGVRLAPLYGKQVDPATIRHLALAAAAGIGRIDLPGGKVQTFTM